MPSYDFVCERCGAVTERFIPMRDLTDFIFGECTLPDVVEGSCRFKLIINGSDFRLKGTGWYETDGKNSAVETQKRIVQ